MSLLTGGGDKPYALGMAAALTSVGIRVDFIGSDDLSVPELLNNPRVNFLNLRGDQRPDARLSREDCKGIEVLCEAHCVCCDGKAQAIPYIMEQQVPAPGLHAVDALLQIAWEKGRFHRPQC